VLVPAAAVSAFAALAVLAARADLVVLDLSLAATATDLTVGLAFVVAAALPPTPAAKRLRAGGVGAAWLLASAGSCSRPPSPSRSWLELRTDYHDEMLVAPTP
jgi:hypothetical protein